MIIKKFRVFYGGYFADSYEVTETEKGLLYRKDWPMLDNPPKEIVIDEVKMKRFLELVAQITSNWIRQYWMNVCDGIQWEIDIQVDDVRLKFFGSNAFPKNYHLFLRAFRKLIDDKSFAEGHSAKESFLGQGAYRY